MGFSLAEPEKLEARDSTPGERRTATIQPRSVRPVIAP